MVGGPKEQWSKVEPIFKTLSAGDNYGLVGPNGAGHFVKMVHNGIEYGMMEAIAEGYSVMQASPFKPDLAMVTKIYQQGSVVTSWLIDLMADIFAKEDIEGTLGLVRATGEGEWTVKTAKEFGVPVPIIEGAFKFRVDSAKNPSYIGKVLSALRNQFGHHDIQNNKSQTKDKKQ